MLPLSGYSIAYRSHQEYYVGGYVSADIKFKVQGYYFGSIDNDFIRKNRTEI